GSMDGGDTGPTGCTTSGQCDDGLDCTADSCDAGTCVNTGNDSACTAGTGGSCIAGFGCQYDGCSPSTCVAGACAVARCGGDACVIESACTASQMCCGGFCVALGCDDGDVCTDDSCGTAGCQNTPNSEVCDDGSVCNGADTCGGGTCSVHGGDPCGGATVCDEHTGAPRRPAYDDVVLLFRGMGSVSLYEEALREAGIPYALVAGAGFYQRQEITDVINILKVLLDPWDDHALLAWLRGPAVALTDDDIVRLANTGPLGSVVFSEATPENMNHPERLAHARNLYEALQERRGDALPDLLQFVLEVTGLEAVVLSQYLGLQKASNMRKLVHLAREQAGRGALSLRQFVQYVEEVHTHEIREGEAGLQPESQGAVTLMTMHKSKGLEFPIVFLPDLARKGGGQKEHTLQMHRHLGLSMRITGPKGDAIDTPLGRQIKRRIQEDEEAESARLLYVALTRARDRLYLCGTANPTRGSWFHAFDRLHNVGELPHGDTLGAVKGGWAFQPDIKSASDIKPATDTGSHVELEGQDTLPSQDNQRITTNTKDVSTPNARLVSGRNAQPPLPVAPSEDLPTGDNAWSAIVLRNIPKAIPLAETTTADHAIDREAIARRLAPVLIVEQTMTTISVSRLLSLMTPGDFDGEERPDEDMPRIERDSSYAMDRGTLVHRMFEVWDFAREDGPDVNRLVRDARMGLMHRDALTDDLVAIQQWFAETPLAQRLGSDDVLRREAPFSLRIGNCIVNGTIDLAMADGTLIDYKTGKMKKTSTARYEKQLLLYAAAMQTLTGTMPKAGLLVYVDAKESVEVSFTPERIAAVLDEARSALA
ncbi:MAG: PD-(D/E)XK nuclease family protein, partial [Candidatus Hydrogenedentes bacterium]|nr:PD-(D/E)XK nuclease family protein [Candidatus Hydrogenedentota bacterium]